MSWLDIVLVVLIAVPTLAGLSQGLIKITLVLVGLVVGVTLAGRFHPVLAEMMTFISNPDVANVAAFAVIMLVVLIAAGILASVLKWIASAVLLGWVNRLGGAVVGFLVGAIFCGALLATWVKFFGLPAAVGESAIAPVLLERLPVVLALLPGEFDSVKSFFQ